MYLQNALVYSSLLFPALIASKPVDRRSGPVSYPLKRRNPIANTPRSLEEFIAARDVAKARITRRYGRQFPDSGLERRATEETVALSSLDDDNLFYATVQIGTPPQSLDVQLDTGSSDLWVPVSDCRSCNLTQVEPDFDGSEDAFTTSESSTYHSTNNIASVPYGDGTEVQGVVSTDTVSIGSFKVQNQVFIAAEQEEGEFTVAGLMGLAFPSLASSNGTPWWMNALDQFSNPEFSFYIADWDAAQSDVVTAGGQFTLGGRNATLFDGDPTFVPLSSQDYWTVPLNSIKVTSQSTLSLTGDEAVAIIDSGSTIITGPTDVVDAFFGAIPGSVQGDTISRNLAGEWLIPCNTNVNAQFKFGAATVTLPAAALTMPFEDQTIQGTDYCAASIVGSAISPGTPAWIFGDSLMKGVYTVFRKGNSGDTPSIGFANLKNVNYNGDGTATLGAGTNGVDGRIGNAGPSAIITGTGTAEVGTQPTSAASHSSNGAAAGLKVGMSTVVVGALAFVGALMA